MLTVAKVTGAAALGYAEYLEGKTAASLAGDYYLKDGERVEAPGRWVTGAHAVADPGARVSGEQLRALLEIRRPDTGQALRAVGAGGAAVAALDATFSAPKSVSAVWALGDPELRAGVERAHETAIDRAVAYAVGQVAMVRERVDRHTVIHAQAHDVVASSWRHTTARAVDGQPPDPQLHSHVLLHAAVRADGRVVAIDSRRWLVHRRELGAAYRTELARELTDLGFAIERGTGRGGRYFEIEGVPVALTDRWSSRHHQVQAAIENRLSDKRTELEAMIADGGEAGTAARARLEQLDASARLGAAEDRFLAYATRTAKPLVTRSDLDRHWAQTATAIGIAARDIDQLRDMGRAGVPSVDPAGVAAGLTEFEATFPGHAARAVALEASAGAGIDEGLAVLDRARDAGEVLELADGRYTTRSHRAAERATVRTVGELTTGRVSAVPERLVVSEVARLSRRLNRDGEVMTGEQADAIRLACSDRQLVLIEGQAGTGKSTVLAAVARAHHADGREIVVTSTAGLAARRLADDLTTAGVPTTTYSTAALHAAVSAGRVELGARTTVIHDEAALASTREQQRLFTAVNRAGARLIEVGDPQQSRPVGAGGLWPTIESTADTNHARVELTRNVRARDPDDRRDQKRFRDDDAEHALAGYQARGRVTIADQDRQAEDRALEAAEIDRLAGRRTLVVAQISNEHLDALNARAQAIRYQAGQLGDAQVPVPGRPYGLREADPVQIRRTFIHHDHDQPIRNGTTGQITHVDPSAGRLGLTLADRQSVDLDGEHLAAADLRLAYVQHPFPAQGQTTDTTHLIVAEHATQEGSYVALTRARERTDVYTSRQLLERNENEDPVVALAAHLSRTEPDVPSIRVPLAHEGQITVAPDATRDLPAMGQTPDRDPAELPEESVHPPEYLTTALGQRPSAADPARETWQHAADAVQDFRARYEIAEDDPALLGSEPPAGRFQQRHDRTHAARDVAAAVRRLGRDPDELGPIVSRAVDGDRLTREHRADLDNGYEP